MLVAIYGSSELFVNEYRNMLADRLLSITDYETEKEVFLSNYLSLPHFVLSDPHFGIV